MGLFLVLWAGVFLWGDSVPGVANASHLVESVTGGDWCQFNVCEGGDHIDLIAAAAVASVATVVLKSVWWLIVGALKAGLGREGKKDWMD